MKLSPINMETIYQVHKQIKENEDLITKVKEQWHFMNSDNFNSVKSFLSLNIYGLEPPPRTINIPLSKLDMEKIVAGLLDSLNEVNYDLKNQLSLYNIEITSP